MNTALPDQLGREQGTDRQETKNNQNRQSKNVTKNKPQDLLRQVRILSQGLTHYPPQLFKEIRDHAVDLGEALEKKTKTEPEKKVKKRKKGVSASQKASVEGTASSDSVLDRFIPVNSHLKQLVRGSLKLAEERSLAFIEDSIEKGCEIKRGRSPTIESTDTRHSEKSSEASDAENTVLPDKPLKKRVTALRDFSRGFSTVLSARSTEFSTEFNQCGRAADLVNRQQAVINSTRRRERIESQFGRLGIVSRKEFEVLNQRFSELVNATVRLTEEEDRSAILSLERRSKERRSTPASIKYEMRIYNRRDLDRRAA